MPMPLPKARAADSFKGLLDLFGQDEYDDFMRQGQPEDHIWPEFEALAEYFEIPIEDFISLEEEEEED